jgi:hypothetical protein
MAAQPQEPLDFSPTSSEVEIILGFSELSSSRLQRGPFATSSSRGGRAATTAVRYHMLNLPSQTPVYLLPFCVLS